MSPTLPQSPTLRVGSKKLVQQGRCHCRARSVGRIREHRTMARTPRMALFNRPRKQPRRWSHLLGPLGPGAFGFDRNDASIVSSMQKIPPRVHELGQAFRSLGLPVAAHDRLRPGWTEQEPTAVFQ